MSDKEAKHTGAVHAQAQCPANSGPRKARFGPPRGRSAEQTPVAACFKAAIGACADGKKELQYNSQKELGWLCQCGGFGLLQPQGLRCDGRAGGLGADAFYGTH
jgi:hypothetical protein